MKRTFLGLAISFLMLCCVCFAQSKPYLISPEPWYPGVNTQHPTFNWNVSSGATSYRIQVSTITDCSNPILDVSGITSTTYTISTTLNNGTTYYWRVYATDGYGGVWSDVREFYINASDPVPVLLGPLSGSTASSRSFAWSALHPNETYRLQISTDPTFITTVIDVSGITDQSYTVQQDYILFNSTTYYWRVNATLVKPGEWSDVWSFTYPVGPPAPPVLLSPSNDTTVTSLNPSLNWEASPGATEYYLCVSTNSDYSNVIISEPTLPTTYNITTTLNYNTTYHWRVLAKTGSKSGWWSESWSFTTPVGPPPSPTFISPTNGASYVPLNTSISWNASSGATSYGLQISTNTSFDTKIVDVSNITGTTYNITNGLINYTRYYWHVNASNGSGTSSWSPNWQFTTIIAVPPSPTLSSPVNWDILTTMNPTLSWNASATADTYGIQISTSLDFSTTIIDASNITGTTYVATALNNDIRYYWRVNATNTSGTSAWSDYRNFLIHIAPPPVPVLLSPINEDRITNLTPQLSWNSSTGANYYGLQISSNSSFDNLIVNASNISATSYDIVTGLNYNATYYWRVNATNSHGTSEWSEYRNFSTPVTVPQVPTLALPNNGANIASLIPSFSWNASSNATSYSLQISTSSDFNTTIVNEPNIPSTTYSIAAGLNMSTTYYWRVNATNVAGTSSWSDVWSFSTPNAYAVITLSNPVAGGTTTQGGNDPYNSGSSVTVTATPTSGYTFTNWTENGTEVSADANYTFTITGNRTLTANFSLNQSQFTVTTLSNPVEGGTTVQSGNGTYNSGSFVTVTATKASGYVFTGWTENGTLVSTSSNYVFNINNNRTLTAVFVPITTQFVVTILPAEEGGTASLSGTGTYLVGDSVTVTASPDTGFVFASWVENNKGISNEIDYEFQVKADHNLKPHFVPIVPSGWYTNGSNNTYSLGSIAIGTSNFENEYKLKVNGAIKAKEVSITIENFPDYVFEESYELKSIEDLEKYINENKHLPDIPSAKEVKDKGISLGQIQAKLLQKIEELTLYIIEQRKTIDEQSKTITEQSRAINVLSKDNLEIKKVIKKSISVDRYEGCKGNSIMNATH